MTDECRELSPIRVQRVSLKEGDLLVSGHAGNKFAVNEILKVDRIDLKEGASINIQGRAFTATEDDYLLVVSAAYGHDEFRSLEDATKAAKAGTWTVKLGQVPNRSPGAAEGQVLVGNEPVTEAELSGYRMWREAFDKGEAGIF